MDCTNHHCSPVDATRDNVGHILVTYRNESVDEHVHIAETYGYAEPRDLCWSGCSGDWPGCKSTCPLFCESSDEILNEKKRYEQEQLERTKNPDPFSFMLNHTCRIDALNYYVEEFDTLDGAHWEIALDINQQIDSFLDPEADDLAE